MGDEPALNEVPIETQIAGLSDAAAIAALDVVGASLSIGMGVPVLLADKRVRTDPATPNLDFRAAERARADAAHLGEIARHALLAGARSADPKVADAVNAAVQDVTSPEVMLGVAIFAVGAATLVALAIISKVSYSKEEGWKVEKGLPGIEKAGEAVAALISAVVPS